MLEFKLTIDLSDRVMAIVESFIKTQHLPLADKPSMTYETVVTPGVLEKVTEKIKYEPSVTTEKPSDWTASPEDEKQEKPVEKKTTIEENLNKLKETQETTTKKKVEKSVEVKTDALTITDLRAVLRVKVNNDDNRELLTKKLKEFNATAITNLAKEHYADFFAYMQTLP